MNLEDAFGGGVGNIEGNFVKRRSYVSAVESSSRFLSHIDVIDRQDG